MIRKRNWLSTVFSLLMTIVLPGLAVVSIPAQDPFDLPRRMEQDPKFTEVQPVVVFSERLLPAWIEALKSDDVNLQRKVAESVVIARQRKMKNLQQLKAVLLDTLGSEQLDQRVLRAVAKAIVALDLREASDSFLQIASSDRDEELQSILHPALADWKVEAARSLWKEMIQSPSASLQQKCLACQGLGRLGKIEMVDQLLEIVEDETRSFRLRFAAARGLGGSMKKGLEKTAARLSGSEQVAERILAAWLIGNQVSDESAALRLRLAIDPEPAVAVIAWNAILESADPRGLDPHAEFGRQNRGKGVRLATIRLMGLWRDESATRQIGQLLSDPHPEVRVSARKQLLEFAGDDALRKPVLQAAERSLETNWQGIQQGLLIVQALDHKPVAMRLLPLLDHERAEVHVTAGWTLENLSVPETLNPVFQRLEKLVGSGKYLGLRESEFERMGHLIQLLGKNRFAEMEKTIIQTLIPKDMRVNEYPIRPAAIWSLGQIYSGRMLPEDLQVLLRARILDDDPMNPEHTFVKSMCAYTFAMTGTRAAIPDIEKYAESVSPNSRFGFFCNWALNRMDGRPIPVVEPFRRRDTNWFLNPIE